MLSHLFCANNKSSALNIALFLPVLDILTIITKWAVVTSLVSYLTSYKRDYKLIGQLFLSRRLSIGIFPKLGILASLS